ncbi:MAG: hypothetical protein E4H14_08835 [Candidatus Thorarchaeota archaeon]|nr:MAG: hypothetical protein E4H14_08835 [Candidatus Thorarchaeota archaeon]
MGMGRWDDSSRVAYKSLADTATKARSATEYFTNRDVHKALNPRGVTIRESCDSEQNPNSNAIIVGLDVTGSMGMIAHTMAKEGLGTLIESILDRKPVEDPHIMFMAIGDVHYDSAPLQVSQFEPDIRIAQQLKDIYVEGGGGENNSESYDLPWYFAAAHTTIDCFEKRGKKGYLFTIGDELPPTGGVKDQLQRLLKDGAERDYDSQELLKMAEEKYHVFHVIVEQGSYAQRSVERVTNAWRELLGKRAIGLNNYNYVAQVVVSAIEVSEGADPEDVLASWQDAAVRKAVKHALFD